MTASPKAERIFAAYQGGKVWHSPDPVEIAPWAAAADEPVYVRVQVGHRVKATAFRLSVSGMDDPTEYLGKIADAMEEDLRFRVEDQA